MRKRLINESETKLTVGIDELMGMLSLGKNTSRDVALKAGAVIRIGGRTLYNVRKIEEYMESLTESKPTMLEG